MATRQRGCLQLEDSVAAWGQRGTKLELKSRGKAVMTNVSDDSIVRQTNVSESARGPQQQKIFRTDSVIPTVQLQTTARFTESERRHILTWHLAPGLPRATVWYRTSIVTPMKLKILLLLCATCAHRFPIRSLCAKSFRSAFTPLQDFTYLSPDSRLPPSLRLAPLLSLSSVAHSRGARELSTGS